MRYWNRSIAPKLRDAWETVVEEDEQYFDEEAHEDTVGTDFIAELKPVFRRSNWVVGGQYNRMNAKRTAKRLPKATLINGRAKRIRPDIVIHRIKADAVLDNLVMIEIKKWTNTEWRDDVRKLKSVTSPPAGPRKFQYKYGLLIRYSRNMAIGAAKLFINGEEIALDVESLQIPDDDD